MAEPALTHYSAKPLAVVHSVRQHPSDGYFDKPTGLWVSVDGEDDWLSWCRAERHGIERMLHATRVVLADDHNILRLGGVDNLDHFTQQYGAVEPRFAKIGIHQPSIDWRAVAASYQGVIIAPYCWERRMHNAYSWYYTWDCASGCIWDAAAVDRLEPIPAPVFDGEASDA